jgi:hypothetical protein
VTRPTTQRLLLGLGLGLFTLLVIGIPTDLIPKPIFQRQIPAEWWNWPVALASAVLVAVLVALPKPSSCRPVTRVGIFGSALAYFAVGCPTCNHIVVLAVGASGALNWFAPIQPFMALIGLGVLAVAIGHRLWILRRAHLDAAPMASAG